MTFKIKNKTKFLEQLTQRLVNKLDSIEQRILKLEINYGIIKEELENSEPSDTDKISLSKELKDDLKEVYEIEEQLKIVLDEEKVEEYETDILTEGI